MQAEITLRQAAQQALEALIPLANAASPNERECLTDEDHERAAEALEALCAALAEPQTTHWEGCEAVHPECRKPKQEPVAWQWLDTANYRKKLPADAIPEHWRPLYTAPTPRRSVELTDAEILSVLRLTPPEPSLWPHLKGEAVVGDVQMAVIAIARAIEHAHGIGEQHE